MISPLVSTRAACRALGVAPATIYRWRYPPQAGTARPRPRPARRLSELERSTVLRVLNSRRFCDSSPAEVYATLLDEGRYLCSERTMYRLLAERGEGRERRDQLNHPAYTKPELLAQEPNEVWAWDFERHEAPCDRAVMKGTAGGSSQRATEAGGNPTQGTLGRAVSSPDNDGTGRHCQTARVRQASGEGVRKKPVSERPSRENHQLQPGGCGLGRGAHPHFVWGTPWSVDVAGREATPKVCGVGVARSQGHSWAPHPTSDQEVNVGTGPLVPSPAAGEHRRTVAQPPRG